VPASDALCNALQVINHLQDCADDYRELDRVYLPQDWMAEAGIDETALAAGNASQGLRQVMDHCLAGTRTLLAEADRLAPGLTSTRLAMESAVITRIAHRLVEALSHRDPLAERVVLSKPQYAACAVIGAVRGLVRL